MAKVVDFPSSAKDRIAGELVTPLEEAIAAVLKGDLKTYLIVGATADGQFYCHKFTEDTEMGEIMSLLAAVELAKADLVDELRADDGE